jgi:LacI family transcriptional regulator, galactose operon repressor
MVIHDLGPDKAERMRKRGAKVTIREVARSAGVSVGTVSRVLNANETVQPEIRRAVQKAIAKLGYAPNAVAQSMRIRSTHTVGCMIREINIPQLAGFVRAAHDVLDAAGYSLLISNSEGRREREFELLSRFSRRRTDGLMIGPYTPIAGEFEEFLRSLDIPIVVVDRDQPEWADAVNADHAHGTRLATEHLLDLGHRRIALLTGDVSLYPARERLRGFDQAHQSRGIVPDRSLIHAESFLPAAGFRFTSAMLGQRNPPTAVISGGIDMLSGVLRAIRARGASIPEDICVVASGHSELAELYTPAISVIAWDQAEVGRIAAGMLLDRLRGRASHEPRRVLLPTEFVLRASVARPAAKLISAAPARAASGTG